MYYMSYLCQKCMIMKLNLQYEEYKYDYILKNKVFIAFSWKSSIIILGN